MRFDSHAPVPEVVSEGPLPGPVADKIRTIVIESQRNLPAMCEVEFWDDDLTVIDNPALRPGSPLQVVAPAASEDPAQIGIGPLFDGEVVALEAGFTADGGSRLVLRGYDRAHRLHRDRRTRTFLMQTDQAIATQIASDHGLAPRVDATGGPSAYLCQHNQTDWEFLAERAREIGFEMAVSQGALVFRRAGSDPLAGTPQRLQRGDNLLAFRPRATSAEQAATVTVRSWDAERKLPVVGVAPPPVPENTPQDATLLPTAIATRFGATEDVETEVPFDLPPAATARAMARRDHAAGVCFEADGTCLGNPAMQAGGTVRVDGVGVRFSGSYTLTSVRHVFDEHGFQTHFTISGRHDRSLLGLTQPGAATRAHHNGAGLASPVVAKVTNTADDLLLGRVKVEFPWLGERAESNWAPVVSVGAGASRGLQVTPEVGDMVLVAFAHGDIRRPYVLGGIHNAQDPLPQPVGAVAGGQTNVRVFRTRIGHTLTFDDTPGAEAVTIETHLGSRVTVAEGPSPLIELVDASGKNAVRIDGAAQNVTVEAAGNLDLKAGGRITIDGAAGVSITSSDVLDVEAASTTVKASGILTLRGGTVKIN